MRQTPAVVLENEIRALLASDIPADRTLLQRRLFEIPQATASNILYHIVIMGRFRLETTLAVFFVLFNVIVFFPYSLYLVIINDMAWVMIFPWLMAVVLMNRAVRHINTHLQYRKSRRAIFYLAGLNDVRAIREMLRCRHRRPREPLEIAATDQIERELTRLFDELTGRVFIPDEQEMQSLLRRECVCWFGRHRTITLTRACFYISIMRCLCSQNADYTAPVVRQIARIPAKTAHWGLVRDAARVLVGQDEMEPENSETAHADDCPSSVASTTIAVLHRN